MSYDNQSKVGEKKKKNRFSSLSLCHQPPRSLFPRFSLDTNGSTEPKLACRTFQPNPPFSNFTDMPIKIKTNSFYIAAPQFLVTAIPPIYIPLADMSEPLHVKESPPSFIDFKRFNVIWLFRYFPPKLIRRVRIF